MRLDLDDDDFRAAAETWLRALSDDVIVQFTAVVDASPGYYPTTLHTLWLAELARRGLIAQTAPVNGDRPTPVPVSHPVDADWRFTPQTAACLLELTDRHANSGGCIVHLGAPTTFRLGVQGRSARRHVLLERSEHIVASLLHAGHSAADVHRADLNEADIPRLDAQVAIIDPPWYPADTVTFLTAGAVACRTGAVLLLCQPTPATRPSVLAERAHLEAQLPSLGLSLEATLTAQVRYVTPHFEAMSLRLANPALPDLPTWRVGDLMILRKMNEVRPPRPSGSAAPSWMDIRFGPVRLKIRSVADAPGDMVTIVPGDMLTTVSRRDPARDRVGLWTSGNRVYGLVNAAQVAQLIRACSNDLARHEFTLVRTLRHAKRLGVARSTANRLFDVLLIELQEHRAFEGV